MGSPVQGADQAVEADTPITARHVAMTWAQRLKRVFGVEIDRCTRCGLRQRAIRMQVRTYLI